MYSVLPSTSESLARLNWSEIEPWYRELIVAELSQNMLLPWLAQWSRLSELVEETLVKQEIACTQNTGRSGEGGPQAALSGRDLCPYSAARSTSETKAAGERPGTQRIRSPIA